MIGVYITFNDVEYIGYEDIRSLVGAQNVIAGEVNRMSYYILKNTKDGDIMFPANALYISEVRLVKVAGEDDEDEI